MLSFFTVLTNIEIHGNAKVNIITDDLNCIIFIFERGKAFYFPRENTMILVLFLFTVNLYMPQYSKAFCNSHVFSTNTIVSSEYNNTYLTEQYHHLAMWDNNCLYLVQYISFQYI